MNPQNQDALTEDGQMKTTCGTRSRTLQLIMGLPFLLATAGFTGAALADDMVPTTERVSVTRQSTAADRDRGILGKPVEEAYGALTVNGQKSGTTRASKQSSGTTSVGLAPNTDFWFYDADVDLYFDRDADGYFYGIDLWFDADTYYSAADVYAVVYLSYEGGQWNEYASTDDFTLYGASSDDDYIIETDLISGYPTGSYDLLIELFDAFDGTFLASIGPGDTSELSQLTLEDSGRDAPIVVVREVIVRSSGGGGATGLLMLILLVVAALGTAPLLLRQTCRLEARDE
jgi:hypothetical protein